MAVFHQICQINEIDPQAIQQQVLANSTGQLQNDKQAENLIRTALDSRAKALMQSINLPGAGGEYVIDSDPAAPSFQIKEDFIRSKYNEVDAKKLIDVLGQVKLPVQG